MLHEELVLGHRNGAADVGGADTPLVLDSYNDSWSRRLLQRAACFMYRGVLSCCFGTPERRPWATRLGPFCGLFLDLS
jgi:hypothetical protein